MAEDNSDTILRLEEFVPYRLSRAYEIISHQFAKTYHDRYGMTRPEWRVFATIGQFGSLTAKEIGQHSAMHKTKVSRAVMALQKRGWLTRDTDENDRRVEHLMLTRAGERAYRDMVAIARKFEAQLTETLGQDAVSKLLDGLQAIEKKAGDRKA